jgi:hypothetical protein
MSAPVGTIPKNTIRGSIRRTVRPNRELAASLAASNRRAAAANRDTLQISKEAQRA